MNNYRSFSKRYIMLSVFYIIAGIGMLVWPHLTMDLLGKALGIGMLVVGIAYIVIYFTKNHFERIMEMDLTIGVVLAAFGSFLLLHGEFVSMALPFAIAVLILIGGISKIQNAIDLKNLGFKNWKIILGCSVVLIILGALLVYNPFSDMVLIYYIGICMTFDGLISIIALLLISSRMKKMERNNRPMPGEPGGVPSVPGPMEGEVLPPQNQDGFPPLPFHK